MLKLHMAKALEEKSYLDDPRKSIVHAAHEVDWKILKNAADVIHIKKSRFYRENEADSYTNV